MINMVWDDSIIWSNSLGEQDFKIIDKKDLNKHTGKNLKEDLINMGFLDYDNLTDNEKKIYDELDNEIKDAE